MDLDSLIASYVVSNFLRIETDLRTLIGSYWCASLSGIFQDIKKVRAEAQCPRLQKTSACIFTTSVVALSFANIKAFGAESLKHAIILNVYQILNYRLILKQCSKQTNEPMARSFWSDWGGMWSSMSCYNFRFLPGPWLPTKVTSTVSEL